MIDVSSVSKNYIVGAQEVRALKKVSLKVETGEFLALAGPSGSGKTTLLNLIGCIDSVTEGIISLDGETISGLEQNKRNLVRQRKIGFIFQSYNLIPVLTARENVALALQLVKGIGEKEIAERTSKILAEVGLSGMEDRKPSQLSGGQQQRVSIARALVKEPPVILADEPTANLDSKTGREILALMRELNEQHDTTFIFSTHDPMVMEQARVLVKLHDGEITGIEKR